MKINKQKGGMVRWIITIIAVIALASFFFNFSVQEVVEDEQTQTNFTYISTQLNSFYQTYLAERVNYIWNDIIVDLLWNSFIENMTRIRNGEATSIEILAPSIQTLD